MTHNNLSKLTVVIPSYKAEHSIKTTLSSIEGLINAGVNVFVVEDGVYDKTADVVSAFNIKHIQLKKNSGASNARNIGLEESNSDYIYFLDADDWVSKKYIENLLDVIHHQDADICFGRVTKINQANKALSHFVPKEGEKSEEVLKRWLAGDTGPSPIGVLWKTNYLKKIGAWNKELRRNDDGELMVRAMLNSPKLAQSYLGNAFYRISPKQSLSKKYFDMNSFFAEKAIFNQLDKNFNKNNYLHDYLTFFIFRVAMETKYYGNQDAKYWQDSLKKRHLNKNIIAKRFFYIRYIVYIYKFFGFETASKTFKFAQVLKKLKHRGKT